MKNIYKIALIKCFIFLNLIFFSYSVSAQDSIRKKITYIGVKLMPGISKMYNRGVISKYSHITINGGLTLTKEIKKKIIYLQSGLLVFNRGFGGKTNFADEQGNMINATFSENLYYLQVPLIANIKRKSFCFGIGPTFNYYLGRKYIFNQLVSTEKLSYMPDFLFGMHAQAGIEKQIASKFKFSLNTYLNPILNQPFLNYGLGIEINYLINP